MSFDVVAICRLFDITQAGALHMLAGLPWNPGYARSHWTATHPGIEYVLDFDGQLRGEIAKRLIEYAERYKIEPVELLSDIIDRVLADDLVDTVMGKEDGGVTKKEKIRLGRDTPSYLEGRFSRES